MAEKRTFNKTSIKDVAKRAEVSVTTVSHVVSGTKGYSQETIKRVKTAIEELNYVPSYAANALRKRAMKTIGVCARDPFGQAGRDIRSFPDRLWAGILEEADLNNYKVMHFPTSIQGSTEAGEFLNGQIDGLIMCANNQDQRPMLLARAGLPVVMVARSFDIPEHVGSVAFDEEKIVELGLNYLHQLGHERIAFIAGPVEISEPDKPGILFSDDVAVARLGAYEKWMQANVGSFEPISAATSTWNGADLVPTVKAWMEKPKPTAIFAANDNIARCVLRAASTLGIDVPGQLSVLGIDNDQESAFSTPSLSSIDVPIQEVGRQAVRSLLLQLRGDSPPSQTFDIPVLEIAMRDSTGPVRN